MLSKLLRVVSFAFAGRYARRVFDTSFSLLRVELAAAALKAVDAVRKVYILFSIWIFLLTLIAAGLAMIPISICLFAPWSPATKLLVMLIFAVVYIAAPAALLMSFMSEKRWMKMTNGRQMVQKIVGRR